MFRLILLIPAALIGVYAYFCIGRLMRFYTPGTSRKKRVIRIVLTVAVALASCNIMSTLSIFMLHIMFLMMGTDIGAALIRLLPRRIKGYKAWRSFRTVYRSGVLPVVITLCLFAYGFYNMNQIHRTTYALQSDKLQNDYRVILITDTHYGTIQDTDLLKEYAQKISDSRPDLVILGGDIVDDNATKESMQEVFGVLGAIDSQHGVYYVFGNHDLQTYSAHKAYSKEELLQVLKQNGITLLQDSFVPIGEDLLLAGRDDAAWGATSQRATLDTLLQGADKSRYLLMVDHQPVAIQENVAAGSDLLVSGHTHGGQIWPAGWVLELTTGYSYGRYEKEGLDVIVSSGFTGWGYPVRTQGICEYVEILLSPTR